MKRHSKNTPCSRRSEKITAILSLAGLLAMGYGPGIVCAGAERNTDENVRSVMGAGPVTEKLFVTPNEFAGTDAERINQAIICAEKRGLRVVVPRHNTTAAEKRDVWLLDEAIQVRSNTILELDNCHIKLSDRCRDNMIRSANCGLGITEITPLRNIRIIGRGNVLLEGADHPRATGDSAKTLGERTYGTDAGQPGVSQTGDWRNIGILLASVDNFRIENIGMKDTHCWAISLERCSSGTVRDIRFAMQEYKLIDGKRETILNQDGLDLRQGCHDITIENISGHTGDDLIALTGINHAAAVAGSDTSTMVSAANCRPDGIDDIRNIIIRNVRGYSHARHHVVRFLNAGGLCMHDIVLDGLIDTSPSDRPCKATVKIGDANPKWGGVTPLGDTSRFSLSNIISASRYTILIAGSLTDSCVSNVIRKQEDGEIVTYESGRNHTQNLTFHNLVQCPAEP